MMYRAPSFVLLTTMLPLLAGADTFLHAGQSVVSLQVRSEELQEALGAVLGCTDGGAASRQKDAARAESIRAGLLPMWRTLPKNEHDRVEWRLLRFVTHRHFMQRFNVLVRGLEPTIRVNSSHAGEAEILSQQGPTLAQALAGPQGKHGFSLDEAVVMIAALEHLLFDSDSVLLEKMYRNRRLLTTSVLDKKQLQALLTDYMVHWIVGDDEETAAALLKDPRLLLESVPHWTAIVSMVEGSVVALEFSRQQTQEVGAGLAAFEGRYTFDDALQVAGSISRNFGSFWETQCQDTKASLVALDTTHTGRVRLPDFYGANKEGEWRFGESEAYLRELGALDETSSWRGKQVIIPNYIQAASNCIVSAPHYLVCCINYCEGILGEIETAVGAPTASAIDILSLVGNMTSQTTLDREDPPKLQGALTVQLEQIAATHGGNVPLHGRLFAQWLHYAFPRECPFPHKTGLVGTSSPYEYGDNAIATEDEMEQHSSTAETDLLRMTKDEEEWMSQWSSEEELIGNYAGGLRAPWARRHFVYGTCVLFAVCFLLGVVGTSMKTTSQAGGSLLPTHGKAHFV